MSEIQVWEHVLKWGLAQNPELPSDLTNFSKEDFKTLKNNIRQCIPFIKFHNLTSREFSDKVLPYRKVLPKELLYDDLLKYFMNLDSQPINDSKPCTTIKEINIDSKIITIQHAELISKWIENTDEIKNAYKFKLLLRGSRDGFTPKTFHEICDNKSRTITIIKVKDSNEILGGYNPVEWESEYDEICEEAYRYTKKSFIFSFNSDNIETYIFSCVKCKRFALLNYNNSGPVFGIGDLGLYGDTGCCDGSAYEKQIRETTDTFAVEEYEVFQIIKEK
ncbi:hypothetical protein RhiirB3_533099 [Rhizophagus irregularis]|nr:hypothetical protein RhiirB3_533099 [Rhizophagus irregularis]